MLPGLLVAAALGLVLSAALQSVRTGAAPLLAAALALSLAAARALPGPTVLSSAALSAARASALPGATVLALPPPALARPSVLALTATLALRLALAPALTAVLSLALRLAAALWLPGALPAALAGFLAGGLGFGRPLCRVVLGVGFRFLVARGAAWLIIFCHQRLALQGTELPSVRPFYILTATNTSKDTHIMSVTDPAGQPVRPPVQQKFARHHRKYASFRVISALMLREVSTRYGATPGGYIWAFAEPMGAIAIMAVAFSIIMRTPHLGDNFIVYYATGYLPYQLFNSISNQTAKSIGFMGALLRYPAVTWVDAIAARTIVNTLTALLVAFILLTAICQVTGFQTIIAYDKIFMAFFMTFAVGLGVGTLNAVLFGLFPVWERIWGVITRPLFIASGVLFLYEEMPPLVRDILWYNPLIHATGLARDAFYPIYQPTFISISFALSVGLISLTFGTLLMGRYYKDLINK